MSAQTSALIKLSISEHVATISFNRPPMNPVNDAVLHQLDSILGEIERQPSIIAVRIHGNDRAFCAGADLKMVAERVGSETGAEAMRDTAMLFQRVYRRLEALPALTIAEIEGIALGGGLELALACDLRAACETATLGLPEAKVGLLPGAGGTQRLTRLCGTGAAARLILSGELLKGGEAHRIGLIDYLAATPEELKNTVQQIISRTCALSHAAVRAAKTCIDEAAFRSQPGFVAEADGIYKLMTTQDAIVRVKEFAGR
ncbi:MAG: enoyl-CoA hydratase/isomerase family protein [Sphingorhabdus sp.]|jgi:enoyl-CoA hydratase/carnithine racemase|nr:enoyl-CoA hydratase/isomerase family protein [Sphingorhabdus sp.]